MPISKKAYVLLELVLALSVFSLFIGAFLVSQVHFLRLERRLSEEKLELYKVRNLYIYGRTAPLDILRQDDRFILTESADKLTRIQLSGFDSFSGLFLLRLNQTNPTVD